MFLKLKDHLGVPGIIAVCALVFAMAGGAWAASGALTGKQKKEVKKIAQQYAGKPGSTGPQGPAGPQGAPGASGDAGGKGDPGVAGKEGKSVVVVNEEPEGCPEEEGVTYEVEDSGSTNEVCRGPEGSPWTAGGTLPSGATETGGWTFGPTPTGAGLENVALTFPIPLSTELQGGFPCLREGGAFKGNCQVHYINPENKEESVVFPTFEPEEFTSTDCLGSAAAPSAKAGNLCIYAAQMNNASILFGDIHIFNIGQPESGEKVGGAGKAGALIEPKVSTGSSGWGTWAVTAP